MFTSYHQDDAFPPESGLTLDQASDRILTYDGHEWEIRNDGDAGFSLWSTPYSRNGTWGSTPMTQTVVYSVKDSEAEAMVEIFQRSIDANWGPVFVMKDAYYIEMMADIDAQNDGA